MKNKYNWQLIQEFYDNGKTIRECCEHFGCVWGSIQKAIKRKEFVITRSKSESMKISYATGRKIVSEKTEDGIRRLRESAIRNELGGKRNSKRFLYNGIHLDSSYEVRYAKILDKSGIKWIRPTKVIWSDANGKPHRYYPDFFLPDYNVYIDTKNKYLIERDRYKIEKVSEQNNIVIKVISIQDIEFMEMNGLVI
jgi:hypothetical protein